MWLKKSAQANEPGSRSRANLWQRLILTLSLIISGLGLTVPFAGAQEKTPAPEKASLVTELSNIEKALKEEQVSRALKEVEDALVKRFSTEKQRKEATQTLFRDLENKGLMPEVIKQFVLERFGRFDNEDQDGFITPEELKKVLNDSSANSLTPIQKELAEYIQAHSLSIARCVNDERGFEDCISKADLEAYAKHMSENVGAMPTVAGKHSAKMTCEGVERTYDIYIPKGYDGKSPVPLVLALHGAFEDAAMMEYRTGFNDKADKEGFIVIYPEARTCVSGKGRTWNIGSSIWWTVDDVEFVETVIKTARQKFNIDSDRIYVAGFSNGGMLAHEVGTRLSHVVAGVASVGGSMNGDEKAPSQPVPVIIIHGSKDEVVPMQGRRCFSGYWFFTMKPTDYARKFWVKHDQADNLKLSQTQSGVKEELYESADGKCAVAQYTVVDGTHTWPGGPSASAGANQSLNATDTIWTFFKNHPRTH